MPYRDLEKRKAYSKAYRKVNKDIIKAQKKAYYEANKDRVKARVKAYRESNKEKIKAHQKLYRESNKEKIHIKNKSHYEANKEQYFARRNKRRALKIPALLPTTDDKLIQNLYKQRAEMTEKHGEEYHVDHIIPLSIGGAHHQDNMRVITAKENLEKRDKYIPELGGGWADNDLARETKKKLRIK